MNGCKINGGVEGVFEGQKNMENIHNTLRQPYTTRSDSHYDAIDFDDGIAQDTHVM